MFKKLTRNYRSQEPALVNQLPRIHYNRYSIKLKVLPQRPSVETRWNSISQANENIIIDKKRKFPFPLPYFKKHFS